MSEILKRQCSNCGAEIPADSSYCQECGKRVVSNSFAGYRRNVGVDATGIDPHKEPIGMWLSFFLWVGVGISTIVSICMALNDIANQELGFIYAMTYSMTLIPLIVIAIMTIRAFYKRESNAVALAYTYITIVALDAILGFVLASLNIESESFSTLILDVLKSLGWVGIWSTFLYHSANVESLIPSDTRTWRKAEKIILTIYIVGVALLGIWSAHADSITSIGFFMKNDAFVEKMIEETNSTLPMEIEEGIYLINVKAENNTFVYEYQMNNIYASMIDSNSINGIALFTKNSVLHSYGSDSEIDYLFEILSECDYDMKYNYIDAFSEYLFSLTITNSEIEQAIKGQASKVTLVDLKGLIEEFNKRSSEENSELYDALVKTIVYLDNDDTELVYASTYAMDKDELMELGITPEYLKEYVLEKGKIAASDPIVQLAMLNKMSLRYEFKTSSGDIYSKAVITPDIYSMWE